MQVRNLFIFFSALAMPGLLACNPQKKLAKQRHEYMENTYADIKKTVVEAEVTMLNDTLKVLFPDNLLFKKGSASINSSTMPVMQRFAGALLVHNRTDVLINGYTDNTGSAEYNDKLSKSRADTALGTLALYKVAASRLNAWGHGSREPLGDNSTDAGRSKNRRVEFIILYSADQK